MYTKLKDTNQVKTLVDFIEELATIYDLRGTTPSKMILTMIATAIKVAIGLQDKYVIEAALKSISLYDFLMTFAAYYDEINERLDDKHRTRFIDKIQSIVNLTRCKKIV